MISSRMGDRWEVDVLGLNTEAAYRQMDNSNIGLVVAVVMAKCLSQAERL